MANGLDRLSSSEVVAALQELTGVLRPTLSEDQQAAVTSNDEAWLAVMAIAGLDATQIPADIQPERSLAAARALLAIAAADSELGAEARPLIEKPPSDDQMFLAGGLEIVVVLSALVTLLQTKLDLRVTRRNGQVDFDVHLSKDKASDAVIEKVVDVATDLLKPS